MRKRHFSHAENSFRTLRARVRKRVVSSSCVASFRCLGKRNGFEIFLEDLKSPFMQNHNSCPLHTRQLSNVTRKTCFHFSCSIQMLDWKCSMCHFQEAWKVSGSFVQIFRKTSGRTGGRSKFTWTDSPSCRQPGTENAGSLHVSGSFSELSPQIERYASTHSNVLNISLKPRSVPVPISALADRFAMPSA